MGGRHYPTACSSTRGSYSRVSSKDIRKRKHQSGPFSLRAGILHATFVLLSVGAWFPSCNCVMNQRCFPEGFYSTQRGHGIFNPPSTLLQAVHGFALERSARRMEHRQTSLTPDHKGNDTASRRVLRVLDGKPT